MKAFPWALKLLVLVLLIPQFMAWDKIQALLGVGTGVISHPGYLRMALPF